MTYRALGIDGTFYEGRHVIDEGEHYIFNNDGMHMIKFETLEKAEEENMSTVSKSYEDPVEIVKERKEEIVEEEKNEMYISPNYKGKNPKTPEQLKAEREERRAKMAKRARHYVSDDPAVNPSHYKTKGGLEAIDLIEAFTEDLPGYEAYLVGSAMKYLCRYKKKNGLVDIKKSAWYVNELIKELEKEQESK